MNNYGETVDDAMDEESNSETSNPDFCEPYSDMSDNESPPEPKRGKSCEEAWTEMASKYTNLKTKSPERELSFYGYTREEYEARYNTDLLNKKNKKSKVSNKKTGEWVVKSNTALDTLPVYTVDDEDTVTKVDILPKYTIDEDLQTALEILEEVSQSAEKVDLNSIKEPTVDKLVKVSETAKNADSNSIKEPTVDEVVQKRYNKLKKRLLNTEKNSKEYLKLKNKLNLLFL